MPLATPGQLLGVVLKLIVIGFAGLFMGFLLTPETWRDHQPAPTYLSQVLSSQETAPDVAAAVTATPAVPRTLASLEVRIGPGAGCLVIGALPRGARIELIGRNAGGDWLAIAAGSRLNGWVPASGVEGIEDVSTLPVAPVTFLP